MRSPVLSVAVTVLLAGIFGAVGVAKIFALPPMRELAHHVGFSVAAYRRIGLLEVAGAIGVAAGLWLHWVGLAAATGLVLLMVGGVLSHLRVGDKAAQVALPVTLAVLAISYCLAL